MPDFPESAKFLTNAERVCVRKRLAADVGSSAYETPYTLKNVGNVFKDCMCSPSMRAGHSLIPRR
jgi:hypothetical protein